MSDTPRTDAEEIRLRWTGGAEDVFVFAAVARQLERELNDALRDLSEVRKAADEYRRENEMLKTEAAKLAESVRSLL